MSAKILIVDKVHEDLIAHLTEQGLDCEVNRELTYDEFVALPDNYLGLIIRSRFVVDKKALLSKPSTFCDWKTYGRLPCDRTIPCAAASSSVYWS